MNICLYLNELLYCEIVLHSFLDSIEGSWYGSGTCGTYNIMFNLEIELFMNNYLNGTMELIYNDSIPGAIIEFHGAYIPFSYRVVIVYTRWISTPLPDLEIGLIGTYHNLSDTIRGAVSGNYCAMDDSFKLTRESAGIYLHTCISYSD